MKIAPVFFLFLFLNPLTFLYAQSGYNLAQVSQNYLRKGQFLEALETLNMAIVQNPTPELYFMRGYAKSNLDDYIGAEQDYSKSLELFPYQPDAYIDRAIVRSQRSNLNGALEDLQSALRIDSTNAEIYFNLARIKLYLKKYYACIQDCNSAIRLNFKNETIYILKGSSEWGLRRFDLAVADFRKAISINPSNSYSYVQLGSVWMDLEKPDSAVFYLSQALKADSVNVFALFNRALARIKLPDYPNALADLNNVVRLSPYNAYAYFNRAILYNDMNDKKRAIHDFDLVIRLNPANIIAYYYRAQLKNELKDYQGALEDLSKTIELYPDHADAYYERSMVKTHLKDLKGGKKDYERAMELRRKNGMDFDTLAPEKKNYLESLVKLSGDFEEMNTINSKFQNQQVEIELAPMFKVFTGKAGFEKITFYDTYKKEHYYSNIVTLTNHPELVSDSLSSKEIEKQTHWIDSLGQAASYIKRAVAYSGMKKFNLAFEDYDKAISNDSSYTLIYFNRAITRYDLIQLINSLNDYQNQITIGKHAPNINEQMSRNDPEHTYEKVIVDLSKAIELDKEFAFAYYNRGCVYCKMGDYPKANEDFNQAIHYRPGFPEAYYNRGLVRILMGQSLDGCEDLSHAGELGIADAYKVMKRYCYK